MKILRSNSFGNDKNMPHIFKLYMYAKVNNLNLELSSSTSLSFPYSIIENLEINANNASAKLKYLGLSGIDSPFPEIFSENIELDNIKKLKILLNIIEQRLYKLLFEIWYKKDLLAQNYFNSKLWNFKKNNLKNNQDAETLSSEFSLFNDFNKFNYNSSSRSVYNLSLFNFQKHLNRHTNSIETIKNMEISSDVKSGWKNIDQVPLLKNRIKLSQNSILGKRLYLANNKVNVEIKLKNSNEIDEFYKNKINSRRFLECIKKTFNGMIDLNFIVVGEVKCEAIQLGKRFNALGLNTALVRNLKTIRFTKLKHEF